ncbi:MAG: hypothetical protein AUI10_08900 [Actinobacteria bacterium 13_2_20CM_2_72_6]|nr:MAG: hypothetical protein AUI10_08900 [Actinobacteria bacterium 13_2_20CM_2_72_6]
MDDSYPKRVSDPAADGIPEYADDDSTAWDDVESARAADGPDPYPVPGDREDGPAAMDEYGTTPDEQRRGEPIDLRLAREEPDVSADPVGAGLRDDPDEADEARPWQDDVPVDPHLDSPVSMYDRDDPGLPPSGPVGRLVAPDEGAHEDAEKDEVAIDAGAAGGGASAEELAMHPVPDDETA